MRIRTITMVLGMVALNCRGLVLAQPPTSPPPPPAPIPLSSLVEIAQTTIASCKDKGWPVAVTIVDPDQSIRLVLRAEGAGAGVVNISRRKALTV